ncbi:MAG: hypothetical protein JXA94_04950, partial [Parachlamydiales bacterium]|nr:hypothetical protein [Parachlamydiales bacterium]
MATLSTLRDLAIKNVTFGAMPATDRWDHYNHPIEKSMVEFFISKNFSVANGNDVRSLVDDRIKLYEEQSNFYSKKDLNFLRQHLPAFVKEKSIQDVTVGEFLKLNSVLKDRNLLLFFENVQNQIPQLRIFLQGIN